VMMRNQLHLWAPLCSSRAVCAESTLLLDVLAVPQALHSKVEIPAVTNGRPQIRDLPIDGLDRVRGTR